MSSGPRAIRARLQNTYRGQLYTAGQTRNTFEATVPHDTPPEKVLEPSYWWPHNARFKPLDRIEVTWDDGSRIAMLRVSGIDEKAETVLITPIGEVVFDPPELPAGYTLAFDAASTGWKVIQEGRHTPLRSGFATAHEAHAWLVGETAPVIEGDESDEGEAAPAGGGKKGGGGKPLPKPKPAQQAVEA